MLQSTTAIIADADELYLDAFAQLLQNSFGMQVIATTGNAAGLQQQLPKQPHFILIDALLPGANVATLCADILITYPNANIVVLMGNCGCQLMCQLMVSGIRGIITKKNTKQRIKQCLENINEGHIDFCITGLPANYPRDIVAKPPLDGTDLMIMQKIYEEKETKQIAKEMHLSPKTVENRRKALRVKTGAKSIVGIIKYGYYNGIFW